MGEVIFEVNFKNFLKNLKKLLKHKKAAWFGDNLIYYIRIFSSCDHIILEVNQ